MVLENTSHASLEYRKTMDVVNESLRLLGANKDLSEDVRNYFDFSYNVYGDPGGPNETWFDLLSPGLKRRVLVTKYSGIVRNSPLFANASASFIHQLLQNMNTQLHIPGELIVREGSRGKAMYFM